MSRLEFQPLGAFADDALVAEGEAGPRTAAQFRADVLAVAGRLPPAREGSEIVVVCGDRYSFAVGVLAAWEAGHGVALPPNSQPEVVRHLSTRSAVTLLLHDTDAPEGCDLRPWLGREAPELGRRLRPIDVDRHIATVYTSGTTGDHQACSKTAGQLLGEAAVLGQTFGIRSDDRVLATVPPHHIYGLLFGILMPLLAGASFNRDTPFHAETIAAAARRGGTTILVSVPVHLRSLTMLEAGSMPVFRRVFSSGAPLPVATAASLIEMHEIRATEVFGSSETGGIAWRVSETCGEPWQPLPGITVDVDTTGRLLLDSPFVPPGGPRPYVGGDRIELVEGGFRLLGRADGIIKIGAKRVSIAEVENRLLALPGVIDAAIAAVAVAGARGHELIAAVVVRPSSPRDQGRSAGAWIAALRRGLREWFDPVVVPRKIKIVDRLPREANGKLRRQRLLEYFDIVATRVRPELPCEAQPESRPETTPESQDESQVGSPAESIPMSVRRATEAATEVAIEAATAAARRAPVLATYRLRRTFPAERTFVVRSHAVRRQGDREVHAIAVQVPEDADRAGTGPALARMLSQVICRVAGLGRPQRMRGAGLRQTIAPGEALLLHLEVERAQHRVHFALDRGGERCTDGTVDYAAGGLPEAKVG